MKKNPNPRPFFLSLAIALFTPAALTCLWLATIAAGRSIFPTDIYGAYKGWYEPGNAVTINNHYSLDFNFIAFPWKFYLASHPVGNLACTTSFPFFTPGHRGIYLPDGSCYPLGVSCPYLLLDPRRWLERILPFFVAYDLGYLLLALSVWSAAFFLLKRLKFGLVATTLGSAVALETFWISKELQYDLFITSIPFLYLAFACLTDAGERRVPGKNFVFFGFFSFLALLFTSLQGLASLGIAFFLVSCAYFSARGRTFWRDGYFWT
jgi:hypothetical protein